ncbi:MAG: threonine/serine dehydratase [Acidobacteriia bacterium]|nr:threonine/serine dehydratase [Terriglobia bacterium]
MVTLDDITLAASRLRGIATRTPLLAYPRQQPGRELYLKPESLQPIGSFKLRGAYNKIASLADAERRHGVISYSSGNHAQGVAYAARALGVKAVIVMPDNAPQIKIDSTRALGAEIVFVGPASSERKARAEDLAREHGYAIIPPYNDEKIIAGAGTAGLEILADLPDADLVLVPVGGGGLISGIASAFKLSGSRAKVIGVEPELASDAQASFRSGRIVEFSADQTARTLADGLRTQSVGEINFDHIRRFVDDIVTVSESEILAAIRTLALDAKLVAEPSGAVTFAAFLFRADQLPPARKTVAVISGGNIDPALLARVLSDLPHS